MKKLKKILLINWLYFSKELIEVGDVNFLTGKNGAGKSTVMNQMVQNYVGNEEKKVLEKDMLFATLETSVRNIETGDNKPFFLVDTVGFIHKSPALRGLHTLLLPK